MCMSMYVHGVSDHDTTRTAARLFPLVVNYVLGLKVVKPYEAWTSRPTLLLGSNKAMYRMRLFISTEALSVLFF